MDNGDVIVGLNESWSLGGAKLNEWGAGFMVFILAQSLFFTNTARSMPILMLIWIISTFGLAAMRRSFPDEERGIANAVMTFLGFCPPNTPAPSKIQPYWSASPMREIPAHREYTKLGLDLVFFERNNKVDR